MNTTSYAVNNDEFTPGSLLIWNFELETSSSMNFEVILCIGYDEIFRRFHCLIVEKDRVKCSGFTWSLKDFNQWRARNPGHTIINSHLNMSL